MANLDSNINIQVLLDAPGVSQKGFGTAMFAGLGITFPEDIRFYESFEGIAADDAAGLLTANAVDAATAAFSQAPTPAQFAIGKLSAFVAQVTNVAVTGVNAGDTATVTLNGQDASYVVQGGDAAADVVDGLIIALNALNEPVTITDNGADLDIEADAAGIGFAVSFTGAAGTTADVTETTPNNGYSEGLSAIQNSNGDFYGVLIESRARAEIVEAATWVEANKKLAMFQSSDADAANAVSPNVAEDLGVFNRSALLWHDDDTARADAAWMANRLAVNPDTDTTTWAYVTLAGITPIDINATQKGNLLGAKANVYGRLLGVGATFGGTAGSGRYLDLMITADWLEARLKERIAQKLLDASNLGTKIPYTDTGFAVFEEITKGLLKQGEQVGHLVEDTGLVIMPALADVPQADRANRVLNYKFGGEPAGAIHTVNIVGYVTLNLDLIS